MYQAMVDGELVLLKVLVATTVIMNRRHMSDSGDAFVICEGTILAWLEGMITEQVLRKPIFVNCSLSTVRKRACNPGMFQGYMFLEAVHTGVVAACVIIE